VKEGLQYKYIVLVNTSIAGFMALLDSNIVLISLPTIIRKLPNTSTIDAVWILMGYILVICTILLTIGRFGDIFGRVKMYKAGFAVFTVGSGLCSISIDGTALVFFRLLQAIGAALIYSNSTAIITDTFPPTERGRALGINSVGSITGSVIGLVAGGILTSTLGWPSIFWVNVPVGTFATLWAHMKLKELGVKTVGEKPDVFGMVIFGAGMALSLAGLVFGSLSGWSASDLGLMIIGIFSIMLFVYAETKIHAPMMELKLFKIKEFSTGILANLLAAVSRGGVSFVLVFYLQGVILLNALTAGIWLIPFSIAFAVSGPVSGYLSDRRGSREFATAGMFVSAVAFVWFSMLPERASYNQIVVPMIITGIGGGLFYSPNIASIMSSVPINRRGIAAGMSSTLFNAGALLSLGIVFAVFARSVPASILQEIFAGLPIPSGAIDVSHFVGAVHLIFQFMAVISAIAGVAALFSGSRPESEKTQLSGKESRTV
jgi:EmrB/QacA subfamily drug resistance transporter